MVDYDPWNGNFTGTIVRNNTIRGGFATSVEDPGATRGDNNVTAMIKCVFFLLGVGRKTDGLFCWTVRIGIAIGPRVWFGDRYGDGVSSNGQVIGNELTGGVRSFDTYYCSAHH